MGLNNAGFEQANVRANRAPAAGRQARTGENVPRTAYRQTGPGGPPLVLRLSEGLGGTCGLAPSNTDFPTRNRHGWLKHGFCALSSRNHHLGSGARGFYFTLPFLEGAIHCFCLTIGSWNQRGDSIVVYGVEA